MAALRRAAKDSVSGFPAGFWWLWTSTLVNRTGAFVLTFLSLYLTQELGYSAWYAGMVIALHGLGGVAGAPLGGMLTDRWGRRPTMIAGHLGTATGAAALAVVTSAVGVAVVVLLIGVTMQSVRPAIGATIADLVPEHDRRRAYALNYWALNLGFAIAALGGGAAIVFGYRTLFLVEAAATVLCALIVFLRLPETRPVAPAAVKGEEAPAPQPKVSVVEVLRDGPFRTLVLLNLLVCLIFTAPWVGLPLTMAGEGLEPSAYGMVIAVNGVVIVGFQLLVNKITDRRSPAALLTVSSLLFAAGTGATALAGTPLVFAVTVIVWTVGEMVHVPTNAAATARLAPEHARGRYQGVMGMSWALSGFLAPVLAGWVVDGPGPDVLWMACGVVGVIAAVGYGTLLRRALVETEEGQVGGVEVGGVAAGGVGVGGVEGAGVGAVGVVVDEGLGRGAGSGAGPGAGGSKVGG
ncbi:MDR family MFS transporter [Streptomyces sp. NPDC054887]